VIASLACRLTRRFALLAAIATLLAAPAAALETTLTDTGLRYADEKIGGGRKADAGDVAILRYKGWLYEFGDKGEKFDESKRGEPFAFRIGGGRVIQGWDEGVRGMRVGGKRILIIPSELAYGERGGGKKIPPNSDLIFEIELVDLR
jgi:FKBP-type peptidyl-prolyl cis-trans isomerase